MPVINPSTFTFTQTPIGAFLAEFGQDRSVYIADRAMPPIEVPAKAGPFGKLEPESVMQLANTDRTPSGHYNQLDTKTKQDTYACVERGIEKRVDESDKNMFGSYFELEAAEADICMHVVLRRRERSMATALTDTSVFTNTLGVGTAWSNIASTPIVDVATQKAVIIKACGQVPNTLVIGYQTFLNLGYNTSIIDRLKYTNPQVKRAEITEAMLAEALGVEQVLVSRSVYNSADDGQTATGAFVWDTTKAFLGYLSTGMDPRLPQAARTPVWMPDGGLLTVESYRDDSRRANVARARQHVQEKSLLGRAGSVLTGL